MFRHMQSLQELEYISQISGHRNTGYKYKITYWDNIEKIRTEIKEHLQNQLSNL